MDFLFNALLLHGLDLFLGHPDFFFFDLFHVLKITHRSTAGAGNFPATSNWDFLKTVRRTDTD